MKIVVTGGSGQLGAVVLRKLIDDRAVKRIVSLDLRPPSLVSGKLRSLEIDVRDPEIGRHMDDCDALIHLAFIVTKRSPRPMMDDINVEGSKNVFRAAASKKVRRIVYASSIAAYGLFPDHPVPITEDTPRRFQPDFAYAANKYEVEAFLDAFETEHPELAIVRIRPSVLIGARMENPLARLLGQAMSRGLLPDVGGAPVPLVWDEDAADAVMLALRKDVRGAFNVSADDPVSAKDLAEAAGLRVLRIPRHGVRALAFAAPLFERLGLGEAADPAWQRHSDIRMVISSARARRDLGWSPRYPKATDVIRRYAEVTPGNVDRRIAMFFRIVGLAARRAPAMDEQQLRGVTARVHLSLTGRGGGDFGIVVQDGRLRVAPGIPRPPTSVATMKAVLFIDLLAGRASFSTAQLTGRVRIEGEPSGGFILGGMLARYEKVSKLEGVPGLAFRALTKLFSGFSGRAP